MKNLPGTISLIFIIILNSCTGKMKVDLVINNAVIYTVDKNFSMGESMAVKDGKVIAVGNNKSISDLYRSDDIIDAAGKSVYPGFIDPHCHFYGYGESLEQADLAGTKSFAEIVEILKTHADAHPEGWITGRGWDQNDWEEAVWPDNSELNVLFPDRPVFIVRIDGHAALVNDKALELAGINNESYVQGGEIVRKDGVPTGLLIDNGVDEIRKSIPAAGQDQISTALLSAQENCFAVGLTSVHDCGLNSNVIKTIDELQSSGQLKMKIYAMLNPDEENFREYMYNGVYRTDRLHIASVKLYADGALGSRGARLTEDYSDDPGNKGLFVNDSEFLTEISELAYKYGYQVNTHCIGDAANHLMLDIYSSILKGKNDRRWRIEHSQVILPGDLKKFGEYSVIPSIQATHATSDMYWAGERLGDRLVNAYAYKSLLDQNGWLPNGSDFPVEDINPLYGFYAAVSRKDKEGWPEEGFQASESLSREEALRAMTIWAARAAFEENETGSLEAGKSADFVITDRDIMKVAEKEIPGTRVLYTFSEGEKLYSAEKDN